MWQGPSYAGGPGITTVKIPLMPVAASEAKSRWVGTPRSAHLRGRKRRDTVPEMTLRRALHADGFRFRLQQQLVPRSRVDIVLPRYRLAVFVDGCFWHGCPQHRTHEFGGPNAMLWVAKIQRNIERDRETADALVAIGWKVIRLWECEIEARPADCVARVRAAAVSVQSSGTQ